jgi:hypothetical protein
MTGCNLDSDSDGTCDDCDGSDGSTTGVVPPEAVDLAAQGELEPPAPDTLDLIQEAQDGGTLTKPEAIGYKIDAWFGLDDLPAEYGGGERTTGRSTMTADRQWVYDNFTGLSAGEQTALEPFILPPDDSHSLFSPEYATAARSGGSWNNLPWDPGTGTDAALIYYYEESGMAEQEVKAEWIHDALTAAWPKFKQLLGLEPTDLIDVYLSDTGSDDGLATWFGNFCEICVNRSLDEEGIKSTTAHELFHCFQYYVPMLSTDDHEWLSEVTAVWSEHHVYPNYNSEWGYHSIFFSSLRDKRIVFDGNHEYGNYLVALFADQYSESSTVGQMVLDAKTKTVPQLLYDNFDDFPEDYRQFSLYCFNKLRWRLFTDDPAFPSVNPVPDALAVYKYEDDVNPRDATYTDLLPAGGISYDLFTFGPEVGLIGRVEFDFETMPQDEKIKRTGIFYVDGEWYEEDWSDRISRQFCRVDEDELVTAVVLIIANSDMENSKNISYGLKVEGDCGEGSGYVRWTETLSWPAVPKELRTIYYQEDWLEYDDDEDAFVSQKCYKNYSYYESTTVEYLGTEMTVVVNGSGTLGHTYTDEHPVRLRVSVDRTSGKLYMDTDDVTPTDWVNYYEQWSHADDLSYTDGPLWGVALYELYTIDLGPEDFTDSGIKGSRTYDYGTAQVEIEFQYDGL